MFDVRCMAKEQKQEQAPAPAPDVPETPGPPKSYRLQITLGFVVVVLFQVIGLYMMLPAKPKPTDPGDPDNPIYANSRPAEATVERQINSGQFKVKAPQGDSNVTFSLVMHVKIRKGKEEYKFDTLYLDRQNEIIDSVNSVLTWSTAEERNEPGYTTIKEKAKRAINKVLGTSFVLDVLIAEVTYETN